MTAPLPRIAITAGEPAGIGPELVAALAATDLAADLIAIGDAQLLQAAAKQRGIELHLQTDDGGRVSRRAPGALRCVPMALRVAAMPGRLDVRNAAYVIDTLARAADGCLGGEFDAVVTAPVQKSILIEAGFAFTGHTEFFAERAHCDVAMLLVAPHSNAITPSREARQSLPLSRLRGEQGPPRDALKRISRLRTPWSGMDKAGSLSEAGLPSLERARGEGQGSTALRVALATTHLPLRAVAAAITQDLLVRIVRIVYSDLRAKFHIADPRICVLGLNPHAGESGHLGREEIDTIVPALATLRGAGIAVDGPLPADTAFLPALRAQYDAYLAMYHDQGLPVLKALGFGDSVNVTLGLPFVRTSVDHGTALDLAGSGRADASSLIGATRLALELTG
ncbi:MAG: PdxA family dehydrogenase [Rudaea sp.]